MRYTQVNVNLYSARGCQGFSVVKPLLYSKIVRVKFPISRKWMWPYNINSWHLNRVSYYFSNLCYHYLMIHCKLNQTLEIPIKSLRSCHLDTCIQVQSRTVSCPSQVGPSIIAGPEASSYNLGHVPPFINQSEHNRCRTGKSHYRAFLCMWK